MREALVAGHICLDVIPELRGNVAFEPGRLIEAGPATLSTGGAVSNTGLALTKLGIDTHLVGKIGRDLFGRAIRDILDSQRAGLGNCITVSEGEATSYTVVVNLDGVDRMFLHAPGCNNTFTSADVPDEAIADARLMHFGYPPLMARMYEDGGRELVDLFRRAKKLGATTSLDMSLPDSGAPSGQVDWAAILAEVLPYVDIFLPSVEELLFCLERPTFEKLKGAVLAHLPSVQTRRLAKTAMSLGAKIVGIKVGSRGFYMGSSSDLSGMGRGQVDEDAWKDRHVWHPCYEVKVVGTTGAGDATIAGFLMGVLRGFTPMEACRAAVATGACCCEKPDAVSGIRSWEETLARISEGWNTMSVDLESRWRREESGYVR